MEKAKGFPQSLCQMRNEVTSPYNFKERKKTSILKDEK
jgi:hypothetical protein